MTKSIDDELLESPYSETLVRLAKKIDQADTIEERARLMMALAAQFFDEHDYTDACLDESFHYIVDQYQKQRMIFQQTAMSLARLALAEVQVMSEDVDSPEPIDPVMN